MLPAWSGCLCLAVSSANTEYQHDVSAVLAGMVTCPMDK